MNEAKVIEVLRRVEWVKGGERRIDIYEKYCPWCTRWKSDGHADDCKLDALLAEANEIEKIKLRLAALATIADTAHALRVNVNMCRVVHSNADCIPAYLLRPLYGVLDALNALNEEE